MVRKTLGLLHFPRQKRADFPSLSDMSNMITNPAQAAAKAGIGAYKAYQSMPAGTLSNSIRSGVQNTAMSGLFGAPATGAFNAARRYFSTPQPPKPPQPPVSPTAPQAGSVAGPGAVGGAAGMSHQMIGEGFVKGMGGLLGQNPVMQNSKMRDAWSTLTTRTGNTASPAAPLTPTQRSPGMASVGLNQLDRLGRGVRGTIAAGTGLLGWGLGRAGQAIAGRGGFMERMGDEGQKRMLQGAGQVAGNVVGSVADGARWGHATAGTLARQFGSPEYAAAVEKGYKDTWGDTPGKGWADQAERYASGLRTNADLNPLDNSLRYDLGRSSAIANMPNSHWADKLHNNLMHTFTHPDYGMFGLATGAISPGGGGGGLLRGAAQAAGTTALGFLGDSSQWATR